MKNLKEEVADVFRSHMGAGGSGRFFNMVVSGVEQFIGRNEPSDEELREFLVQLTNGIHDSDMLIDDLINLKNDYVDAVNARRRQLRQRVQKSQIQIGGGRRR